MLNFYSTCRHRLVVRTRGFQSRNRSSTLRGGTVSSKYYLKVARANDLKKPRERALFRFFEILPGLLSWSTFGGIILFSWLAPSLTAIFIILFVVYWFVKITYFSFYLKSGYEKMRKREKINWLKKLRRIKNWQKIYHLVLIPVYKEPLEILEASISSIKKSNYPKSRLIIVLSYEERAGRETEKNVLILKKRFGKDFFKFSLTCHPKDLEEEIPGHGSNDAWASKFAKEKIIDPLSIPYENVIVSSFDADTVVFPQYFSCLTYHYLTSPEPCRTSFQPIPLYINNIWQTPAFSRIFAFSSTFWHTMNQERPEKLITFSSHAMSFKALVEVGFKQKNVVSDDSRIFWQCFFYYDGNYRVQPLFYPLSMDANCAKSTLKTAVNIYRQQRRWAYGVAEIPYFLFGCLKNKKVPFLKKLFLGFDLLEGHWSWATASLIIFLLAWAPIFLGGGNFSQTLLSYNLPTITSRILTIATFGIIFNCYLSIILLPPKPPNYGRYKYLLFAFSWILLPVIMVIFSALPALEAQTRLMLGKYMGFWPTEKTR